MNQSNDNIRHNTRLGRHKRQDMSVTIDVNDVFEEVVKQNERLVKEIEFYEEVVNDLITNVKTCIVCQQNNVIKDRISELVTHLKSKTIDNSTDVKSDDKDCDKNVKTKDLQKLKKTTKRCIKKFADSVTSDDDNDSDRSGTTNVKIKTFMKTKKNLKIAFKRNEKIILRDVNEVEDNKSKTIKSVKHMKSKKAMKRCVKDNTDSDSYKSCDMTDDYDIDDNSKRNVKTLKKTKKIILKDVDDVTDGNINRQTVKSVKTIKPYSDEYEEKRQRLKDDTLTIDGSYQCQTCDYKGIRFEDLERHVNVYHLNIKPFKCAICGHHLNCYHSLSLHKNRKHYYIGQGLDQLSDKQKSQIAERLSKFQCRNCQKFCYSHSNLKRHVLHAHHKLKPSKTFACDLCDRSYCNSNSLIQHKRIHHGIGRKLLYYYCDWEGCQYKATNSLTVSVHKKRHLGIRDYACDWPGCEFRAVVKSDMTRHKVVHSDNYDYRCQSTSCEFRTKKKYNLKKHMDSIHKDIPHTLVCHWPGCDKTFRFTHNLRKHMTLHNKPHLPCPHCNKLFTTKRYLGLHMATHTGSLRVMCPIKGCNIEISSKNNIRHHMRVHHKDCTGN
ncbi:zinc finger protein 718-like [Oppia nitens]|uniref:zinc finger protein 718-like n=1 Tax=Oppia nitens TaxID=1686743 RepID=UPI0023DAC94B|nr:zinc finger protein 718-like [Oppia nitens]